MVRLRRPAGNQRHSQKTVTEVDRRGEQIVSGDH
jgi:hypothetical protein